jgi:hypothetical protein
MEKAWTVAGHKAVDSNSTADSVVAVVRNVIFYGW